MEKGSGREKWGGKRKKMGVERVQEKREMGLHHSKKKQLQYIPSEGTNRFSSKNTKKGRFLKELRETR